MPFHPRSGLRKRNARLNGETYSDTAERARTVFQLTEHRRCVGIWNGTQAVPYIHSHSTEKITPGLRGVRKTVNPTYGYDHRSGFMYWCGSTQGSLV